MTAHEQSAAIDRQSLRALAARAKVGLDTAVTRVWPERVWSSALTPSLIAGLSAAAVVLASGAAWVQTRLDALRPDAPASAAQTPAPPSVAALVAQADDFTLSPDALQALSAEGAKAWNAALPVSTLPILAARPFVMAPGDLQAYSRALDCMTAAVYYEAANEPARGQAAVAQVVLNRMRHPAYPNTVCGVVFEGFERPTGCQFSFTCDGALARPPSPEGWARARAVASAALNGVVAPEVGMATHYHADYVAPFWAPRLVKIGQLGAHIFYRWTGAWGLPAAFAGRHAGTEPVFSAMAPILTAVELQPATPATLLIEADEAAPVRPIAPTPAPVIVDVAPQAAAALAPIIAPEPAAPAPAPTAPVLADPLARPDAAPERRRRIAAPSGW